ncbi:MAG: DUF1844 domain-containing protein [Candidatus Helarchaeota archaeon]|nr:DUF1844 domain-containing protein [Candidatus Helarchaeota archaeon]
MEEKEKKIDDGWKENVEKEKLEGREDLKPSGEEVFPGEPDFTFFVTTLSIQAAIALGEIPNPVTDRKEENLSQAKLIIDTLAMIKEKTRGNLSTEEDSLIDNVLYELRMQYVSKAKPQG